MVNLHRPMNILHLNHSGSRIGGVEEYIADVAVALEEKGHSSHLVYFSPNGSSEPIPNSTYALLPEWPEPAERALRTIEQTLVDFDPDVVYVHAVYHPDLVGWIAQRLPTVAYVHAPYLVCPGSAQYLRNRAQVCTHTAGLICLANAQLEHCCWGRNPLVHLRLLKRVRAFVEAYGNIETIFVGSRFMRRLLERAGIPSGKLSVLAPVLIRESIPPPKGAADSRTVLFAGRLVPEKGLRSLINTLADLETDWQLLVAGDGEERVPCQAFTEQLGVADRVRFRGWLNGSEMDAAFRACAVVAVPSLWPEPFGRVGPEASLYGRPVVAFAVGGIPDWLEDGLSGYVITPGDTGGFGRAVQSLLESPSLRSEMGRRSRQRALSAWNAHVHVDRLLSAFAKAQASI